MLQAGARERSAWRGRKPAIRRENGSCRTSHSPKDTLDRNAHACFIASETKERNPSGIMIDPTLFDPAAISDEIRTQNAAIVERLTSLPDQWSVPPALVRERRAQGLGPFPPMKLSERARSEVINGPRGPIPLRIIAPGNPRGAYLHIHG